MVGIWYSFTLLVSYMVFNPVLLGCIEIPNFDGSNDIFPGSDYRKVGKSLLLHAKYQYSS